MLAAHDPTKAYRRVELDACVAGSDGRALVLLCIEDVRAALMRARWAHSEARVAMRRAALVRAGNGLGALRLGVDQASPLAGELLTLYGAMSDTVVASQSRFNSETLLRVIGDLDDIAQVYRLERA